MRYITVRPAYGRNYKTKAEVLEAWKEGKDFQIVDLFNGPGRYLNYLEAPKGSTVNVRYDNDRKVLPIKVPA